MKALLKKRAYQRKKKTQSYHFSETPFPLLVCLCFSSLWGVVVFVVDMPISVHGEDSSNKDMDSGKYVRYTPEQVEALERLYAECPKPSSSRRQQLIRECHILANVEPKQIKVWFQNRR